MIKLKDILKEIESAGEQSALAYLNYLKQKVKDANVAADARYNQIVHSNTTTIHSNPFEPYHTSRLSSEEGHRTALADGQYQMLKKLARDLEDKLRRLEKRFKKTKKL